MLRSLFQARAKFETTENKSVAVRHRFSRTHAHEIRFIVSKAVLAYTLASLSFFATAAETRLKARFFPEVYSSSCQSVVSVDERILLTLTIPATHVLTYTHVLFYGAWQANETRQLRFRRLMDMCVSTIPCVTTKASVIGRLSRVLPCGQ